MVIAGSWDLYYPIPRDRGGYDTFEILREGLDIKLRQLLEVHRTTDNLVQPFDARNFYLDLYFFDRSYT